MPKRIYLAGPIQHVQDNGKGWRGWLKSEKNNEGYEWVDPLDKYDTMDEAEDEWTNEDIVEDDLNLIAGCDGILTHWSLSPTAGTPMEVFFQARYTAGPVVVQTTLHESDISPWIDYHADFIAESFEEALDYMDSLEDKVWYE